jgi:hypothetical protein
LRSSAACRHANDGRAGPRQPRLDASIAPRPVTHALAREAAYGTLLREPRRAPRARIAETLEWEFAEIADGQPELLAHHCTEAGLIEEAAGLWGRTALARPLGTG